MWEFSIRGDFIPKGTFGTIWMGTLWLSYWGCGCYRNRMRRQSYLAPNINGPEAEMKE